MCHNPPGANHLLSSEKVTFTSDVPATGHRPYVVLIDDDEDDSDLLSSSLELLGLGVKAFASGYQALYYLDHNAGGAKQPSLIILDYNMPGLNGQQVLQRLKSRAHTKAIPVVMYSTSISTALEQTAAEWGALACFTKPFTMLEFKGQIQLFKDWALAVAG
jgi:CheY-like chemotaxis protein